MSLTNPNKVVTEQRLSEFYQQIRPYLGMIPEAMANKFSKGDLYDTSEKMIGKWIDGKPLYQKTIETNFPVETGWTANWINCESLNIDKIISQKGFYYDADTNWASDMPIAWLNSGGSFCAWGYQFGTKYIGITYDSTGWSNRPVWITLQYTKTTDSINSFNYSNETDYSTSEKIVGTWIDSKPIYQKTIDCGSITEKVSTIISKHIDTGISGIDTVIKYDAYGYFVSNTDTGWFNITEWRASQQQYISTYILNNDSNDHPNHVRIQYIGDISWISKSYVTIQYTKTTD